MLVRALPASCRALPTCCVQVRTQTLVKSAIIQVDAAPFKQWYQQHYGVEVGQKKKSVAASAAAAEGEAAAQSNHVKRKLKQRNQGRKLDQLLDDQFATGRLYAAISSRPGQVRGAVDGWPVRSGGGGGSATACSIALLRFLHTPPNACVNLTCSAAVPTATFLRVASSNSIFAKCRRRRCVSGCNTLSERVLSFACGGKLNTDTCKFQYENLSPFTSLRCRARPLHNRCRRLARALWARGTDCLQDQTAQPTSDTGCM